MGVCPTEALELESMSVLEAIFGFLKEPEPISCKKNFVCLAALGTEYLVALGLAHDVELDIAHCKECDIAPKMFPKIEDMVAEANYILENIGGHEVRVQELGLVAEESPNRREFFNLFTIKGALKAKQEYDLALQSEVELTPVHAQAIKEKSIPNRRKLLFSLLKQLPKPDEYRYLENEHLSFTSDKEIDSSCDNCSICYRICPTAALSTDRKQSAIFFDPLLCVRCHLCHDVCEKESIKLSEYFDTKEFFEPQQKVLAKFEVIRCEDCGAWFSYFGGERLCPRCAAEEDAARELWGLK